MTMKQFLDELSTFEDSFTPEAVEFYENLKSNLKQTITDNGIKILKSMKDNEEKYLNVFSSKQLGELLFMPPRSVSGSMKKLLADGYVEKKSQNPVTYGLTTLGRETQLD